VVDVVRHTVPDNVHQLHVQQRCTYEKPEAASAVRLLMMGGVSPETCWASYQYGIIQFLYIVASCWIFLYEFYYDARIHQHQVYKSVSLAPCLNENIQSIKQINSLHYTKADFTLFCIPQAQFQALALKMTISADCSWYSSVLPRLMPTCYLKSGHNRFFPHLFENTVLATNSVTKYKTAHKSPHTSGEILTKISWQNSLYSTC
jgi:hypothetical protein